MNNDEQRINNIKQENNVTNNDRVLFEVKDIRKNFKNLGVLKGVNLKINYGEKVALLGPNGAGKSTFIDIIYGIKKQTSGTVGFFKEDGTKIKNQKELIQMTGVQFQDLDYPKGYKVRDIINYYYDALKIDKNDQKIVNLSNALFINELLPMKANKLSGGQSKRFNIYMSLLKNSKFLILDELTAALDISTSYATLNIIKNFISMHKQTLLLVSHLPEEVEYLADRIVIIDKGVIWSDKTKADILKDYRSVRDYMIDVFVNQLKADIFKE